MIRIIGTYGPAMPWPKPVRKKPAHAGGADPIWGTAFTTKFSAKPDADQPLVAPKGAGKVLDDFLKRAADAVTPAQEWTWIKETVHLELATDLQTFRANAMEAQSLDLTGEADYEAANIADLHLRQTPFATAVTQEDGTVVYAGAKYIAAMKRRIEWERYIYGCGPIHKTWFEKRRDGQLGIQYDGPERDTDITLEHKREHKRQWLARHEVLPDPDVIVNEQIRHGYYKRVVLATMNDEQFEAHRLSKLEGDEDDDPGRVAFHANPDPRPRRDEFPDGDCRKGVCDLSDRFRPIHRDCDVFGWALYNEFIERWEAAQLALGERGYAGPSGQLGVDETFE